jgi:acyl carrier protein
MTASDFLSEIDEITLADQGTTAMHDKLVSLPGWDSMAVVMFLAMVDDKCNATLNVNMLVSCETVSDLAKLCGVNETQ